MDSPEFVSEDRVLAALRDRDPQAASMLLDVFGDRIYGLSRRILGSEEDAEESVQETFLKIWDKWSTFKGQSKFSSWVYRIAANCAYMRLRKTKRKSREVSIEALGGDVVGYGATGGIELPTAGGAPRAVAPDKMLENKEILAMFDRAVASLGTGNRTAYILKDVEGMSLKDIADAMNVSEAAVKSRIHRARMDVRKMLKDFLEDRLPEEGR